MPTHAFWQSSAPGTLSTLVTSVVLYSLTRATLMNPGKDETRACGYIYLSTYQYICLYIYTYTYTYKYIYIYIYIYIYMKLFIMKLWVPTTLVSFLIFSCMYIYIYKKCNLCLNEKLVIIDDPDKKLLNKRSEVISQCRHRNKVKLVNLTSRKTPNDVI